jgi:predicted transcriptional regulator
MNSDFMVNFGNIIKKSRQKLGITQAELGQKVDRPQSSIARLESGQLGDTHFGFILDLAQALDMPAENLVAAAFGREMQFTEKSA